MSTATHAVAAPSILTRPTFKLADRLKIQQQRSRDKDYIVLGRLTSVLFEAQRNIVGLSQSQARYHNAEQAKQFAEHPEYRAMEPFSEMQAKLWAGTTLDWLNHDDAPMLAVSRDRQDLLLPRGLTPLPKIPNPLWVSQHAWQSCPVSLKNGCAGCIAPRIPQLLTGCPIVGDRVTDKITSRDGRIYGILHPIVELCVTIPNVKHGFGRIRGAVDPADQTHLALLIDDSNPLQMQAYFVGGRFQLGR